MLSGLLFTAHPGEINFVHLVRSTKVLVLDEAAAHLDFASEQVLMSTFKFVTKDYGATFSSIALRSASLKSADKVAIIRKGAVAEVAPFNVLAADTQKRSNHARRVRLRNVRVSCAPNEVNANSVGRPPNAGE